MEKAWPETYNGKKIERAYMTYQDPTTMRAKNESKFVNDMLKVYGFETEREELLPSGQVRVIQKVVEAFALNGYAVSASGAKKLLYHNAHKGDFM
jgi:hypothetical protein